MLRLADQERNLCSSILNIEPLTDHAITVPSISLVIESVNCIFITVYLINPLRRILNSESNSVCVSLYDTNETFSFKSS